VRQRRRQPEHDGVPDCAALADEVRRDHRFAVARRKRMSRAEQHTECEQYPEAEVVVEDRGHPARPQVVRQRPLADRLHGYRPRFRGRDGGPRGGFGGRQGDDSRQLPGAGLVARLVLRRRLAAQVFRLDYVRQIDAGVRGVERERHLPRLGLEVLVLERERPAGRVRGEGGGELEAHPQVVAVRLDLDPRGAELQRHPAELRPQPVGQQRGLPRRVSLRVREPPRQPCRVLALEDAVAVDRHRPLVEFERVLDGDARRPDADVNGPVEAQVRQRVRQRRGGGDEHEEKRDTHGAAPGVPEILRDQRGLQPLTPVTSVTPGVLDGDDLDIPRPLAVVNDLREATKRCGTDFVAIDPEVLRVKLDVDDATA
jgi:hypothetical protein